MIEAAIQDRMLHLTAPCPMPQEYHEAVQNPAVNFADIELACGNLAVDRFGLPQVACGMFASVYRIYGKESSFAIRCFLQSASQLQDRYQSIQSCLRDVALSETLEFEFQEMGIRVNGLWYPILKMPWCEGQSLTSWLLANLFNKEQLQRFLEKWISLMAKLRHAGIAHGDLQHGNIFMEHGEIRLLDYDGMYVPALQGMGSNERGHSNYQHPDRNLHFGPWLDNFSAWLIYFQVHMLALDPSLWDEFAGGEDCIFIRARDLQMSHESEIFSRLENHRSEEIRKSAWLLRHFLTLPPEQIPELNLENEYVAQLDRRLSMWLECRMDDKQLAPLGLTRVSVPVPKRNWWHDWELEHEHESFPRPRVRQTNHPYSTRKPLNKCCMGSTLMLWPKLIVGFLGTAILSFICASFFAPLSSASNDVAFFQIVFCALGVTVVVLAMVAIMLWPYFWFTVFVERDLIPALAAPAKAIRQWVLWVPSRNTKP